MKLQGNIEASPEEFHLQVIDYIDTHCDFAWTLKAPTAKGFIPVGFLYGVECDKFIHIIGVEWLDWASLRNKLETILKFIVVNNSERVFTFQTGDDMKFMNWLCRYGVVHRAGTLEDIYEEKAPFYQTRLKRKKK